jgi:predicted ATPase/class 3 adenylate cyclase
MRFCGECGHVLPGPAESRPEVVTAPAVPQAERRLVSVLFVDLVGFTTTSETRDAEEVRDLLTRYFETVRELVARYGGTVEKFIGDAAMAVWGTPTTNEDDAERAVRAGLDLVAAVAALGEEVGLDLQARAGVLTGEAAVTIGATNQGMVAGDLVNTASRIQGAANPGSVIVGDRTKHATESAIAYRNAGIHELKGRAEPIHLWQATRVVGLIGGGMRSREIEPPFTGRDAELRVIKELFHATANESRAHLVSVSGVGGIGKSRLAWEFEKYIDGLAAETWWLRGRCLAYGEGIAFWALAEMVRGRAGILEDEDSASAGQKLRSALERHVPVADERRFIEPRLLQLLGLEARAAGDQENLFSAWRLYFERLADDDPLILVFEDLHWADSALLDFIEYLLEWSRERPIFILTLTRPELLERRPTWGAARRSFTSLFLEPLTRAQVETLLDAAVRGLPDELREQILERAEGIPFYAVETVRMLLDQGALVQEDGTYRTSARIETLEVPSTLQALIAARLDGLSPEERRALLDASVLGRTFTVRALIAVSGSSAEAVAPILEALVRKEMLSIRDDPLSPELGQYGFLQDLVRRVAYDMLSRRDRRDRHLAAAAFLAEMAGVDDEDVIEVIAAHRFDAYQAAPDGGSPEEKERTATTLVRAGERAASLGANVAAEAHFQRAAGLIDDTVRRAEVLERAGMVSAAVGRSEAAAALYAEAESLFRAAGLTHPAARIAARAAEILWDLGRFQESLQDMDRAFNVLASDPPDADLATLAAQLGRFMYFAGNLDTASDRIEAALDMSETLGLPEILSQALNTKALVLNARDRRQEAFALMRHALQVALEHDKPSAALRAYNNVVDLTLSDDDYVEAQRFAGDGLQLARRVGNRYWEETLLGLVYPWYAQGEWDEVESRIAQLNDGDTAANPRISFTQGVIAVGVRVFAHRGAIDSAEKLLGMGAEFADSADAQERLEYRTAEVQLKVSHSDHAAALAIARDALELHRDLGWADFRIKETWVTAVESALALGDTPAAETLMSDVAERAIAQRIHFYLAHGMRFNALVTALRDERDGVEARWKSAIGLFRELGNPFFTAVSTIEMAEWMNRTGRGEEAGPHLDEAEGTFRSLRAAPWVERVEAARAVSTGIAVERVLASAGGQTSRS